MTQQLSFAEFEPGAPPQDRLFFAFQPDAPAAAAISKQSVHLRAAHGLTGRTIDTARLHVTLFHIGDFVGIPRGIVEAASKAAASLTWPPTAIVLDHAATFRGRPGKLPFVLIGGAGVEGVVAFQRTLVDALARAGVARAAKTSFTPHVTMMYADHEVGPEPVEPIRWTARELVLVHSLIGESRHEVLARWPLVG